MAQLASSIRSTLPISTTNWYLFDQANIVSYVIPRYPSYLFTEGPNYKVITNAATRRDKLNDMLYVA